jgi:putative membrane protein
MMGGFDFTNSFGWSGMLVGMLLWIGALVLIVWLVFAVVGRSSRLERETPLEILKRRYAAGEINYAEFEQARKSLE